MSGTTYAPSYTVDLVSLPSPTPATIAKPAPSKSRTQPKPVPEKKVLKPTETSPPKEIVKEIQPSGGDEAARFERRRRIQELEMEARRLYESFTSEEEVSTEDRARPAETAVVGPPVTNATTGGGNDTSANIKSRVYYDRIWGRIRSSWVPQGVTSEISLIAKVGIRIAPNGEIEQFWIEKSSGNDYFDQSALRAIRKANPLPALPDDISDTSLEVGINFRYPE
jgi:TonB family protein